jgi:hypothetical protein
MVALAQARHEIKQTPRPKSKIKISTKHSKPAALYTLLRKTSNFDTDDQYFPVDEPVTPTVQNIKVGSSSNKFPVSFSSWAAPTKKTNRFPIEQPPPERPKAPSPTLIASESEDFASLFLRSLAPSAARQVMTITFRLHTQCRLAIPLVTLSPWIIVWKFLVEHVTSLAHQFAVVLTDVLAFASSVPSLLFLLAWFEIDEVGVVGGEEGDCGVGD